MKGQRVGRKSGRPGWRVPRWRPEEKRDVCARGQAEIHFLEILLKHHWYELVRPRDDKVPFADVLIQRAHNKSAAGNTIIFCPAASAIRSCNSFKNVPAQLR